MLIKKKLLNLKLNRIAIIFSQNLQIHLTLEIR